MNAHTKEPVLTERINWVNTLPFFAVHLMPLGALWTGVRVSDFVLCFVLYYVRMFFITAGFHRYFAHKSYATNRFFQFILAFGGGCAAQKGGLWWAAHHRHHHRYSDQEKDVHSPTQRGLWWSHVGWILCNKYNATDYKSIKDFAKYPELVFLNKYHLIPPIALGTAVFFLGGPSALFIGFFLSTTLLYHGTFVINSLTHTFGRRRYVTTDTSRNSFILAMITCGEGWHNNHHYYQACTRQGFFWWELDASYYTLKVLSWFRIVKDLREPPPHILKENLIKDGCCDIGMFEAYWHKASLALATARRYTGELRDAKVKVLEDFAESTRAKAQQIARIPSDAE